MRQVDFHQQAQPALECSIDRPTATESTNEHWTSKVLREVELVEYGLRGFSKAANESLTEHPWKTAGSLALSGAIGFGMARWAPSKNLLGAVLRAGGTAMGLSFNLDIVSTARQVGSALYDNWQSDKNWKTNKSTMEKCVGQFAFDTTIMTVGGRDWVTSDVPVEIYRLKGHDTKVIVPGGLSGEPASTRELRKFAASLSPEQRTKFERLIHHVEEGRRTFGMFHFERPYAFVA